MENNNFEQNIKLVYVSGKIDYGKTNITTLIHDKLVTFSNERNYHVTRFSFGDKVKEIARHYMFWDGSKDDRGRKLLTDIGNIAGRGYDSRIWVKHFNIFLKKYSDLIVSDNTDKEKLLCFIDDWRYPNEFDTPALETVPIPNDNKYGIRIYREIEETKQHQDESETSLPDDPSYYDFFLENVYDTFDELKESDQFNQLVTNVKNFINE